ncbi:anti-sigma factor RsiW [Catenuloplanes nepalensis]|uniref:Anti-sigma factor RsiW n=1 Tax=Catenuloplanes nepalensis TaxID=587533 RepID=A0ABT9MXD0_9ACTN|nr:zf-HC2 domain-containing protein [Catenuloplanes nepalensis]MDP9796087.1 anti-sigma factor RsiW [Catenuloplanes nepalensis]
MTADRCTDEATRTLLGLYALGRLSAAEHARTVAHLADCTACRAEVAELDRVTSALGLLTADDIAEILAEDEDLPHRPPPPRAPVCHGARGTRDRRPGRASVGTLARGTAPLPDLPPGV